jgi:sugar phosphate isomerase/epimerase
MTRRSFCRQLTTATLAALIAPTLPNTSNAQDNPTKRKFSLCLNPGAIGVRANQQEAILLAHQHGFESVEPMASAILQLNANARRQMMEDLKTKNLAWGSAGLTVDFRGDENRFQSDLKAFPETASALQQIGVSRVNTWITPGSNSLTYLQNFQLHRDRLRAIATILHDHDLRLGLEYVGTHTSLIRNRYPFLHTLAETLDLIHAINTGNVGLVLDSWHWWQAGDSAQDLLQSLTDNDIIAVDLNDAPAGIEKNQQKDNERELPAATGVIHVQPFLQTLVQLNYSGPVRAEPFNQTLNQLDNNPACAATIAALRKATSLIQPA